MPRRLSNAAVSIKYRHAKDGQYYVHQFGPGVRIELERSGNVKLTQAQRRKLWRLFPLDSSRGAIPYLVNSPADVPRRVSSRSVSSEDHPMARHRRHRSRRSHSAARSNPRRHSSRRRRRAAVVMSNPRKRRRRSHTVARSTPRRHHSRSRRYGSNPPRGIDFLGHSLKGGFFTYAGRLGNKKLSGFAQGLLPKPAATTPAAVTTAMTLLTHIGVAAVLSLGVRRFLPRYAEPIANGAMSDAIEQVALQTPLAPQLSAYTPPKAIPPQPATPQAAARRVASGMQAYPQLAGGGMRAYTARRPGAVVSRG